MVNVTFILTVYTSSEQEDEIYLRDLKKISLQI